MGDDPDALLAQARELRAAGNTTDAMELLDRVVREFPEHQPGWARRGAYRLAQGDLRDARDDLSFALHLDEADTDSRFNRALVHHQLGDIPAARADLERCVAEKPGESDYRAALEKLNDPAYHLPGG